MIENWNTYQERSRATAFYPGNGTKLGLLYATLGCVGDAGEVAEHGKKCLRDDGGILTSERRDKVIKELGDVTWYFAAIARESRFELEFARLTNPLHFPEKAEGYPGRGTSVGFGYLCARLAVEVGKLANFALLVMPYTVPDSSHWTDVGQGSEIRIRISTAVGRSLWYAERVASEAGSTIDHVMSENILKLASRQARGTLSGEGSER